MAETLVRNVDGKEKKQRYSISAGIQAPLTDYFLLVQFTFTAMNKRYQSKGTAAE